ncbi:hypothetical protein, partial [Chitinimonas prasina]|uniref:hypothetical protein n=1 Tax=Chitinimonas prasina TaxID=1434937 RepID=UPI0024E0607E
LIGCILLKSVCFFRPTPLNSFVSLRFCLRQQQGGELYVPQIITSTPIRKILIGSANIPYQIKLPEGPFSLI